MDGGEIITLLPDDASPADILTQRPPTLDEIIAACTDYYNVPRHHLAAGRDRLTSHARRCIYYFARRYLRMMSCEQIIRRFGKRSHSTVIAGAGKVASMQEVDEHLRDDIDILERRIAQAVLDWRWRPCR